MKRKIGELRNIPIVEGDKNLVREGTEIHINDLQSKGSSSEGSSKYAPRYYAIDWDKASEDWNKVLTVNIENIDTIALTIGSTYKVHNYPSTLIIAYPNNDTVKPIAFSILPLIVKNTDSGNVFISNNLKEGIITIKDFFKTFLGMDINLTMEGITEITEEEYYKMD